MVTSHPCNSMTCLNKDNYIASSSTTNHAGLDLPFQTAPTQSLDHPGWTIRAGEEVSTYRCQYLKSMPMVGIPAGEVRSKSRGI